MKRIYLLLSIILASYQVSSQVIPLNDGIDIKHYTFQLELNDSTNIISGTATIQILFEKNVTAFELDLVNKNSKGAGMIVKNVLMNGSSLKFTHQQDKLKIALSEASKVNDLLTFIITYSGIPQDGLIISKNIFGDRTFFGDNWPNRAHHWLPTIDHPSDKASVDFIVTAPSIYEVIGNGIKIEESFLNNKQKRTHWKEEVDLPTKVMVIGAARFAIHHSGDVNTIPVESWVYPQNRTEGFYDYAIATNILKYFNEHIGPYPYKKLANVQSTTRYGGMENASNIFYFEKSVNGKNEQENLIAHEIAHQWFGNSASEIDWHHVWLSEGFATYFTHLYTEFHHGRKVMEIDMQKDRNSAIEFNKTKSLPIVFTTLPQDLMEILSANSYQKGGWVLHMLRNEVGDIAFWAGIRKYYRNFSYGNAQTIDFQNIMEEVSGKNLDLFFNQWLFRAGHPNLDGAWSYDAKTKMLSLSIDQVQKGQPFDFQLEVGIYAENQPLPKLEKVRIDKAVNKFSIPISVKPVKISLDPNTNLLFEGKLKN
ncbi:MAG: M1 family metallopeptidase [Chryseolinea sp.]